MKLINILIPVFTLAFSMNIKADEFDKAELQRWQAQFNQVADKGRQLWTSPELGSNGVVCAQCHPNGANTHPETYPKFQKQLGHVAVIAEMINWCMMFPHFTGHLVKHFLAQTAWVFYTQ